MKISVIVPIFNVEQYLKNCLESIVNQTYANLEIILVDDGSTDSCGKIIDEYAKKDERIKTIHKENGGLSDARNAGINIATGELFIFIDSDDEVNINMISILYNNLIKYDSDISVCSYQIVSKKEDIVDCPSDSTITLIENDIFKCMYNQYGDDTIVAWNKLYKKYLFDDIRYPKGKIHEDEFIIHKILSKTNKIVFDNRKLYYYYKRNNSITAHFNLKRLDCLTALEERLDFFKENNEMYDLTLKAYCIRLMYIYAQLDDYKDKKREVKEKFNLNFNKVLKSQNVSFKDKIKVVVAKQCPKLLFYIKSKK